MTHALPSLRTLKKLATWDGPFPIQNRHLRLGAIRYGFSDDVLSFLEFFPRDEIFTSREDFMARCQMLTVLLRSGKDVPHKTL